MSFSDIKDIFELLAYVATFLGVPIGIYIFYVEREKEIMTRKKNALSFSSQQYVEFLKLIINYPKVDLFAVPNSNCRLSEDEKRVESALVAILIDMFEQAYLMYHENGKCIHNSQWSGWSRTIKSYCYRRCFRDEWGVIGNQFDTDFVSYINQLISDSSVNPE